MALCPAQGGPPGFLKVLDNKILGFVDFRGNRPHIGAGNIGAVVDGFVFPTLAQHYGWQHATAAVLPLLALTAAAVMVWADDRSVKSGSGTRAFAGFVVSLLSALMRS